LSHERERRPNPPDFRRTHYQQRVAGVLPNADIAMSIEELEEKIHRAVVRLSRTEDSWLRRVAIRDIAAMRAKLAEMKEAAAITA
jgi:hypothetical protein